MSKYYDGTKLLSMKDLKGSTPEIYIIESNRTDGKTTFWNRYVTNRFIKHGEKFALLYRYDYELSDVSDKFFKDIQGLFFPDYVMSAKSGGKGKYYNLFLKHGEEEEEHCGYAIALNNANYIKNNSHLFSDVARILMDEFQSEDNRYCDREIIKFRSIHTSIARGKNKQVRYVPVIMLSNCVSILNPYYIKLGITDRLREDTKFLRGNGFVLEHHFNESASKAQAETGFNRAFADDEYTGYSLQNVYLNDNKTFISKVDGKCRYICTLRYLGCDYAIREYAEKGIVYCDDSADKTYPVRISITTDDHDINYVMLRRNDFLLSNLRYLFEHGCFRFKNLSCKDAVLNALKY